MGSIVGINGWGIGALTASPALLDDLVNTYRVQHIYNYGGMLQYALAKWLTTNDPAQYLKARSHEILKNKQAVRDVFLQEFGYGEQDLFMGDCTNFILFSLPRSYAARPDGVKLFLNDCLAYGIVLTDAWPKPYDRPAGELDSLNCIRLFAGASPSTIQDFLERLRTLGFHYNMPAL